MANDYTIQGREIYSVKGKLVAVLDDDGNPVMAPGMQGPHTAGVREFVQSLKLGDAASCRVKSTPLEAASPKSKVESPKPEMEDAAMGDAASRSVNQTQQDAASPMENAAGMPHLQSLKSKVESPENETGAEDTGAVVKENLTTQSQEDWMVAAIPEDMLPPFSAALGVNTPGFQEYVKKHKLTMQQVAALVKRLSA